MQVSSSKKAAVASCSASKMAAFNMLRGVAERGQQRRAAQEILVGVVVAVAHALLEEGAAQHP